MRWLLKFLIFLAIVAALLVLTADFWGFWLVKGYLMRRGYGCTADRFELGFWPPRVEIEDLVITNPKDFPDLRGVRVARLKLVVPYKTLMGQGHRIEEAIVEIPELVVVRTETGELNWQRLRAPKRSAAEPRKAPAERRAPALPGLKTAGSRSDASSFYGMKADRITVKLGTIEFRDYREGPTRPPQILSTDLNIDKTYEPVPNVPLVLAGLGLEISLKAGPDFKRLLKSASEKNSRSEP